MKYRLFLPATFIALVFLLAFTFRMETPGDQKMSAFIDDLMKKMTLEEKLGQLNLPGSGDIVTGQTGSSDIGKKIKEGKVGGLFNIKSIDKIRDVQKVAVEQSRLKIPLIFGMDVIHGYQTAFPIPLALASSFDMALIERVCEHVIVMAEGKDLVSGRFDDVREDVRVQDAYLGRKR